MSQWGSAKARGVLTALNGGPRSSLAEVWRRTVAIFLADTPKARSFVRKIDNQQPGTETRKSSAAPVKRTVF
jgi:hypothetical protein